MIKNFKVGDTVYLKDDIKRHFLEVQQNILEKSEVTIFNSLEKLLNDYYVNCYYEKFTNFDYIFRKIILDINDEYEKYINPCYKFRIDIDKYNNQYKLNNDYKRDVYADDLNEMFVDDENLLEYIKIINEKTFKYVVETLKKKQEYIKQQLSCVEKLEE